MNKLFFSVKPIQTYLIDDEWIKEKNIEMDIVLPVKNIDIMEDENLKNGEERNNGNKKIKWNDSGLEELIKRNLDKNDFIIFK